MPGARRRDRPIGHRHRELIDLAVVVHGGAPLDRDRGPGTPSAASCASCLPLEVVERLVERGSCAARRSVRKLRE